MINGWFLAGAILSGFTWGIHTFLGGPPTVGPLLESSDIDPVAKYTNYYCWHIVTIVLLAMPTGFALAAFRAQSRELAILMTAMSAAFMLWSVVLILWKYRHPWKLPQWTLFLPITAVGIVGSLV